MWDHLPNPLPISNELECPRCKGSFKLTQDDHISKGLTCPHCGMVSNYSDCISQEAIVHELTIARKKMETLVYKSNKRKSFLSKWRRKKEDPLDP